MLSLSKAEPTKSDSTRKNISISCCPHHNGPIMSLTDLIVSVRRFKVQSLLIKKIVNLLGSAVPFNYNFLLFYLIENVCLKLLVMLSKPGVLLLL